MLPRLMRVNQLPSRDKEFRPLPPDGRNQRADSGETEAPLWDSKAGTVSRHDQVAGGDEMHRRPKAIPVHRGQNWNSRAANSIVEPL